MTDQRGSNLSRLQDFLFDRFFSDKKFSGRGFLASVFGGWGIELIYGLSAEHDLRSGIRTFSLLWFASGAAFFAGTIGGFLFGVPKSVSNPANTPAPPPKSPYESPYKINTNLEEISDWLTKIILGLGLVHLDKVIRFVDSIGQEAATAIGQAQGAKLIAISAMIYGFVCGFIVVYIWTRTTLRVDFEEIERNLDDGKAQVKNQGPEGPSTLTAPGSQGGS
jgi:hypothetical protein